MFEVRAYPAAHRVEFKVTGALSEQDAAGLSKGIREAAVAAKAGGSTFSLLADMREAPVLTQAVAKVGEETMAWCAANGMIKSASLTTSALVKMQGSRINRQDGYDIFTDRDEAVAWLGQPVTHET